MAPKFNYKENDMRKAVIEYIETGENLRKIAKKYNVPHNTLLRKAKAGVSERKMGPATVLTSEEETLLVKYITANAQKGIPINKEALFETIQNIIKEDKRDNPFKDGVPGRKWFDSFMKRHTDVSKRHAESINKARASVTEASLREWHNGIRIYLEEVGHADILEDPRRILNADESGFAICPDTGVVLAPKGMKNLFSVAAGSEKDNITVLVTANAAGLIFPPLICFAYERIPKELANNVNPEWFLGRSKSGWMTGEIFYEYVANKLIPDLKKLQIPFPVLFFVDGHKSHLTLNVAKLCDKEGIILYALYPNATHIVQPADVSIFKPLKGGWKKTVADWKLKTGNRTLTKVLFPPLLELAFNSVGEKIVANGFKKCGLYPFNADAIDYSKCMNDQESRQTDPTPFGAEHMLFVESMIPSKRLMEFKNCPSGPWQGEAEAAELFLVWKKLKAVSAPADITVRTPGEVTATTPGEVIATTSAEKTFTTPGEVIATTPPEKTVTTPGEVIATLADITLTIPEEVTATTAVASTSTDPGVPVIQKSSISAAFANHLLWPSKSPLKSHIKRKKEKLPNAISSQAWINYATLKENAKEEEEDKKKERQRKREEVKALKEQKRCEKKETKHTEETILLSSSENENLGTQKKEREIAKKGVKRKIVVETFDESISESSADRLGSSKGSRRTRSSKM